MYWQTTPSYKQNIGRNAWIQIRGDSKAVSNIKSTLRITQLLQQNKQYTRYYLPEMSYHRAIQSTKVYSTETPYYKLMPDVDHQIYKCFEWTLAAMNISLTTLASMCGDLQNLNG